VCIRREGVREENIMTDDIDDFVSCSMYLYRMSCNVSHLKAPFWGTLLDCSA